jgi:hypothetical protein
VLHLACCGAILSCAAVASPARADFFDDARQTFTNDIPHFFQDDIPCAFGGQPTSHTKTSCKSPDPSKAAAAKRHDDARDKPVDPPPPPPTPDR